MAISKRSKILLLLACIMLLAYYSAKYYDKIRTKEEYELAIANCLNSGKIGNIFIEFNGFNIKEIRSGLVVNITDSLGQIYYNKKEKYNVIHKKDVKDYFSFDLNQEFGKSDTIKIYTRNKTFILNTFISGPRWVRANMLPIFGDGMRPYGCYLRSFIMNGVISKPKNEVNGIVISR